MVAEFTPIVPTAPAEPNGRPAPFVVHEQWDWITCDRPGLTGFAILVRTSLTNQERDALIEQHNAIIEYREAQNALPENERNHDDTPRDREWRMLAPLIREWNAVGIDAETGEQRPLPPPALAGPAAFEAMLFDASSWMMEVVVYGYVVTGKAGEWRPKSRPGFGPRIVHDAE